jgi:hypothetical protein
MTARHPSVPNWISSKPTCSVVSAIKVASTLLPPFFAPYLLALREVCE